MVVKSKRGRRRYIAFEILSGSASYEDLLSTLNASFREAGLNPPKVIQFDGRRGIVRVPAVEQAKAVESMNKAPAEGRTALGIGTLAVSGTLRTLRERYFYS